MKSFSISGTVRTGIGTKEANLVRKAGQVPCVIYGASQPVHIAVDAKTVSKVLFTPDTYVVDLNINDQKHLALIQDVQYHGITDAPLHIDFYQISEDKAIEVELPLKLQGSAVGVLTKGGTLYKGARKIRVKGLLKDIPNEVVIDISPLDLHHTVKISDMKMDNIKFVGNPNNILVAVRTTRASVEEPKPGTAAAPAASAAAPAKGAPAKAAPAKAAAKK